MFGHTIADDEPFLTTAYDGDGDAGTTFVGSARSNRVAPAGIGGECAFYALYVAVVSGEDDVPMIARVYVDDVAQPDFAFTLAGTGDDTKRRGVVEVPLEVPLPDSITNHATLGRWAPRGMWIQVELVTAFDETIAEVQIDGVEIEYDVLKEGRPSGESP